VSRLGRPILCLITDRRQLAPQAPAPDQLATLAHWAAEAIDEVDLIQIREREVDASHLRSVVEELTRLATGTRTHVVVNDRCDVALAGGAHGVHLRGDGPPIARVRALNADWLVGRSIHSAAEAAGIADADFLLFGTVFPSQSKPDGWPATGIDALRSAVAAAVVPVIAVGGITVERAASCAEAGAAGVAAISLFLPPPAGLGIRAAARGLRQALQ
jgi:thiamine-phosphate pyrophosphorylase